MELKWLEDLLEVAELGSFSRAAETRHVTQSALSRRIKSLELWVGSELLDRSHHPISLTPQGEDFIHVAREIVAKSYDAQSRISKTARIADLGVNVACLHTLALVFIPNLVGRLKERIGPFAISIVAETRTVEEYLLGLTNGTSDLFVCYSHPSVKFDIDQEKFPSLTIGEDVMIPYHTHADPKRLLGDTGEDAIPYLKYSSTSFMSYVVRSITNRNAFRDRLQPVYQASLAESLYTAARRGLGLGWIPLSLMGKDAPDPGGLPDEWMSPMSIRIYRSVENNNPVVENIWEVLAEPAAA